MNGINRSRTSSGMTKKSDISCSTVSWRIEAQYIVREEDDLEWKDHMNRSLNNASAHENDHVMQNHRMCIYSSCPYFFFNLVYNSNKPGVCFFNRPGLNNYWWWRPIFATSFSFARCSSTLSWYSLLYKRLVNIINLLMITKRSCHNRHN